MLLPLAILLILGDVECHLNLFMNETETKRLLG